MVVVVVVVVVLVVVVVWVAVVVVVVVVVVVMVLVVFLAVLFLLGEMGGGTCAGTSMFKKFRPPARSHGCCWVVVEKSII